MSFENSSSAPLQAHTAQLLNKCFQNYFAGVTLRNTNIVTQSAHLIVDSELAGTEGLTDSVAAFDDYVHSAPVPGNKIEDLHQLFTDQPYLSVADVVLAEPLMAYGYSGLAMKADVVINAAYSLRAGSHWALDILSPHSPCLTIFSEDHPYIPFEVLESRATSGAANIRYALAQRRSERWALFRSSLFQSLADYMGYRDQPEDLQP